MTKRLGPSGLVRSQASALVAKARGADSLDAVADWQQVYRVRKRCLAFRKMGEGGTRKEDEFDADATKLLNFGGFA